MSTLFLYIVIPLGSPKKIPRSDPVDESPFKMGDVLVRLFYMGGHAGIRVLGNLITRSVEKVTLDP